MKLTQEKSECCGAKVIRFGGKRRRCSLCGKTWRVYPAKRGRRSLRRQNNYLAKVFSDGLTVKQIAIHSNLLSAAIYKRFNLDLATLVNRKRVVRISGAKLILLIDAEWQYFQGQLWTVYFLAVKAVDSEFVTVFDPIIMSGKENASTWKMAIDTLPCSVKKRIIALISDGIRGIETIAEEEAWILQRCHFHLLSALQKRRGKRASTPGRSIREEIYQTVNQALIEIPKDKLNIQCLRLADLAHHQLCPKAMRMIVRDFLRRLPDFRNYLQYPNLNLPTTTNVMESINSYTRRRVRTANSPKSWHNRAIATIRFKSKFNCK